MLNFTPVARCVSVRLGVCRSDFKFRDATTGRPVWAATSSSSIVTTFARSGKTSQSPTPPPQSGLSPDFRSSKSAARAAPSITIFADLGRQCSVSGSDVCLARHAHWPETRLPRLPGHIPGGACRRTSTRLQQVNESEHLLVWLLLPRCAVEAIRHVSHGKAVALKLLHLNGRIWRGRRNRRTSCLPRKPVRICNHTLDSCFVLLLLHCFVAMSHRGHER